MKLSQIFKVGGIAAGIIITVVLLNKAPILIILDGIAAGTYFVGNFLEKKEKKETKKQGK